MKLLEYRFHDLSPEMCHEVAHRIKLFFEVTEDIDLSMLFVKKIATDIDRVSKVCVKMTDVSELLRQTIEVSSSEFVEHGRMISIKSNKTCRFVVIELDAVVRICITHNDVPPDFTDMKPEISDISTLLIESDFFDYL